MPANLALVQQKLPAAQFPLNGQPAHQFKLIRGKIALCGYETFKNLEHCLQVLYFNKL
jgi:hypothetical protein